MKNEVIRFEGKGGEIVLNSVSSWQQALTASWGQVWTSFLGGLPTVLGAIVVFALGLILAYWVKHFIVQLLQLVQLEKLSKSAGIDKYLKKNLDNFSWEIVVVNDGSTDGTAQIIDSLANKNNRVKLVNHQVNLKLGQALRTGFNNSNGEYVVVMDVDLSYSPDHIEKMLKTQDRT